MGTTINGQQITINVSDVIPPENIATIDKGTLVGNTKSKEQLNEWQEELEDKVSKMSTSGLKGEATTTSSPTPYNPNDYPKGLYEKWEVKTAGTYTNFKDGATPPQAIVITSSDLDKKLAYINVTNGVSKKDTIAIPGVTVSPNFDPNNDVDAQSGQEIAKYLDDKVSIAYLNVYLSKYTGINDPTLLNGSISSTFDFVPSTNGDKVGWLDIPLGATKILSFSFDVTVYFQFSDSTPVKKGGGITSSSNINIPAGSTRVYFTVKSGALVQNFIKNFIKFDKSWIGGNPYVRVKDVLNMAEKPIPQTTTVKLNTIVTDFNDSKLLNGYISNNGVFMSTSNGDKTIVVDIPLGAKNLTFDISTAVYYRIVDASSNKLASDITVNGKINQIPIGSTKLYFTIRVGGVFVCDLSKDAVIFGYKDLDYIVKNTSMPQILRDNYLGQIMLGSKLYTFTGDDFRIYQENMFSGFKPRENFNIEFQGDTVIGSTGDKGRYCKINNAGELTVKVYDLQRNLIEEKKSTVFKKNKPTQLNQPTSGINKLQVLFIGDSLFFNNSNKIGQEWLRMLNTNETNERIENGVVYLPTYNIGGGNIELVGTIGTAQNKHEVGKSLSILMSGSNTSGIEKNPFYNPASTNPNELDSEGWNKKIDIAWYLQKVCGAGKFPKYIYLACGVNDIVEFNWDINLLPLVRNRLKAVLLKIKQACDSIAGGNSGVKILLVNHQFYPLNEGHTFNSTFEPAKQRHIWAKHYTEYEKLVTSDSSLNTFVRFVDAASSFDIDHGYDYESVRVNPRNSKQQNNVIDTVHIGDSGSCMYADALLRDFLYNECS